MSIGVLSFVPAPGVFGLGLASRGLGPALFVVSLGVSLLTLLDPDS